MKKILFTITTIFMIIFFGGVATANEIKVDKPEVKVTTSGDRFSPVTVEYKTKFSDDLKINNGDKVIFNLPQELNLQTSYNFDVKGTEGNVLYLVIVNPLRTSRIVLTCNPVRAANSLLLTFFSLISLSTLVFIFFCFLFLTYCVY